MKQVVALGASVEFCGQSQRAFNPDQQKALDTRNDRIADLIKQVGADRIIMETDLGQAGNDYYDLLERDLMLLGRRSGHSVSVGDTLTVRLVGVTSGSPRP
jgi:hypothetical protein